MADQMQFTCKSQANYGNCINIIIPEEGNAEILLSTHTHTLSLTNRKYSVWVPYRIAFIFLIQQFHTVVHCVCALRIHVCLCISKVPIQKIKLPLPHI